MGITALKGLSHGLSCLPILISFIKVESESNHRLLFEVHWYVTTVTGFTTGRSLRKMARKLFPEISLQECISEHFSNFLLPTWETFAFHKLEKEGEEKEGEEIIQNFELQKNSEEEYS